MGLAYYIVTNAEPGTFDACVNGKAVGRSASAIKKYAKELGIPTFSFGVGPDKTLRLRRLRAVQGPLDDVANDFHPVILASKSAPVSSPNLSGRSSRNIQALSSIME